MAVDKCRARFSYPIAAHTLPVVETVSDLGVTYGSICLILPHIELFLQLDETQ